MPVVNVSMQQTDTEPRAVRSLGGEPAGAMAPMVSSQQFSPTLGHMFLLTSLTGGDDRRGVMGCAENWALMARTSP